GFRQKYQDLCRKTGDVLRAEHQIMECLSEALWRAQRDGTEPDGTALLRCMADIVS
ncbi:MAG: DUF1841 family protein, partial [Halothiobacillus sp.]|nr:DUF1841 family protein [Halothiobacillus sp.]